MAYYLRSLITALLLSTLLVVTSVYGTTIYSSENAGPLHIRSQSPVHGLRYTPTPLGAYALKKGETRVSLGTDVSSIWANGDEFVMDFNMTDTRLDLEHGLGNGWTLRGSIGERRIVNAHLDQPTINFHNAVGLGQDGRRDVEKHRALIEIPEYDIYVTGFNNQAFSQPVIAGVSKQVYHQHSLAVAVTLQAQVETASTSWTEQGSIDTSLQFDASKRLQQFSLHGSFAYTWFEQDDFLGLPMRDNLYHASSSFQWHQNKNGSWLIQYLVNEGAADGAGELKKVNHEMSLGYQRYWQTVKAELAITENLFHLYNSPDIAFHGSITVAI